VIDRLRRRPARRRTVTFVPGPDAGTWEAEASLDLSALATGTWDLRLHVNFADGTSRDAGAHAATGPGLLRRTALPSLRHGMLLAHPYATHSGALAVRLAPGVRGALAVARGRLNRLVH
ncbi:hypothetical protein ACMZ5A_29235, partial [Bacillus mobilis]